MDYKGDSVKDYIIENFLEHEGVKYRSGRYPYGSGENPYQHDPHFYNRVKKLKAEGLTDAEIAASEKMSLKEYKVAVGLSHQMITSQRIAASVAMKQKGYGNTEIARRLSEETGENITESNVRYWLKQDVQRRANQVKDTADFLKARIEDTGSYIDITKGANHFVDIGDGTARQLGVSQHKFDEAVKLLKDEGYVVYNRTQEQVTNATQRTTVKLLCPPGTEYPDIYKPDATVKSIVDYHSEDGGATFRKFEYPSSLDSKRLQVVYKEDGGELKDGVIELRRGVEDISLGLDHYSQVRILVDGTHYLKGMAVYSDDLPKGIDVRFNTNKEKGTPVLGPDKRNSVLKLIERDKDGNPLDNPFGSLITPDDGTRSAGQRHYIDKDGKEQLSLINKRANEGSWSEWANTLPSQFLAKQDVKLIKQQLELTKAISKQNFEEIRNLNNPVVKKTMLEKYAEQCDSAAEHLKAASLPRQQYKVLLPLTTISDNEVYAPGYNNGEKVALIRYPHGSTAEIPILKVNNNIAEGKKMMSSSPLDAVGINKNVADRLSGADFDGDTVTVIPLSTRVKVQNQKPLEGLKGFDPKVAYGGKEPGTFKQMKKNQYGNEMGKVSNLITDMTVKGATNDEIAAAIRHSMVVIDAYKHGLDYKQSEIDNNIDALKKKYQGKGTIDPRTGEEEYGGATTLLSRAKGQYDVPQRVGQGYTNVPGVKVVYTDNYGNNHTEDGYDPTRPEGAKLYKTAPDKNRLYIDKKGREKEHITKSTQMRETDDAHSLVSDSNSIKENLYADYANYQKLLANQARKEAYYIKSSGVRASKELKKEYANEIASINTHIKLAESNAPREREAQRIASSQVDAIKAANPDMSKEDIKKQKNMALINARHAVGAERYRFELSEREWEAIQNQAVAFSTAAKLFKYMDDDKLKKLATPKQASVELNAAKIARMKAMQNSGSTLEEIAKAMGVSVSTVQRAIKGQ